MLSVRVSIIGRYILLACVTLRHKTSNYLKISSNTPSKGLTCHQTSSFRTQLAAWCTESAEYCDKSPRCDQISHHTSHVTVNIIRIRIRSKIIIRLITVSHTHNTQHKVFRCEEEPRRVNQSAFQISICQSICVKC